MFRNIKIKNIVIYGGSFDPPHNGHINTAIAVQNQFHFERFVFLPCKTPLLKEATLASSEQRISMLKLALEDLPGYEIDTREITRNTPSFMVETLESFRQEVENTTTITLLMGIDVFVQLPQWHCWHKILKLCNLLVIQRAQVNEKNLSETLKNLLLTHEVNTKNTFLDPPCGKIYRYDAGQYPISSSWLRHEIQTGANVSSYMPAKIYTYVKDQDLYTARG